MAEIVLRNYLAVKKRKKKRLIPVSHHRWILLNTGYLDNGLIANSLGDHYQGWNLGHVAGGRPGNICIPFVSAGCV